MDNNSTCISAYAMLRMVISLFEIKYKSLHHYIRGGFFKSQIKGISK